MNPRIFSVRAKDAKLPLVIVTVECEGAKTKYTITEGTYRDIGCPLSGEEIDLDTLDTIAREDEERRALAKALSILSYADNNKGQLFAKLKRAGFSREAASGAVKECVMRGYINEERQMEHLVTRYARELDGPIKITAKLASRGYSAKAASAAIERLKLSREIDFSESKKALIAKKFPDGASEDEIKKLLYKHGYGHG